MKKYKCLFIGLLTCITLCIYSIQVMAQREVKTINSGWLFAKGEKPKPSEYSTVTIPHTWNTDAYDNKEYYQGIAWYHKTFTLPSTWEGKQIYLKFDAISKSAQISINGQFLGRHKGGYTAFTFDITPYCSFTQPNEITVCADNISEDTPPISGDFTFFGGIYRDVWLIALPKQHFNMVNHGSDGLFIQTPKVSAEKATVSIKAEIKNDATEKKQIEIEHILYNPQGQIVQTQKKDIMLKAGELYIYNANALPVLSPQLWTPETPRLYRLTTTIRDKKNKKILDALEHNTGFRWYNFSGDKGFFLNGKPYKLHGICRHQDQKPIGTALTDEMHRRDMLLMKEMGANFIRVSHYPQDAAILEQCDKLGMLAWEEIPIIDIVPENDEYPKTCEQNLREMIRQHYNHPSIITWGYMNEILLVTQRKYKTKEALKPVLERTLALANRLEKVLKEEDPYRNSTMAFHGSNAYNETGLGNITDIVGWNLYSGWYGGALNGFESFLKEQHEKYPTHPMIVSEYGAGSDKRIHSLQPQSFDFSIEYQQKYLEHYLPVIEDTPYVCGGTHWNFIDFGSALRDESMPRINNKGLVYSDRIPKDVFYYFKAMFRNDIPVLHIASRDWTLRTGIQKDESPVTLPVKIYTNLPEIELFIDGQSLGKKKSYNYHTIFDVPFTKGYHFLRSTSSKDGKQIEDGINIHFTPIPNKLNEKNIQGLELAINIGSNCFFTSTESQLTWIPDQPYQIGSWGYLADEKTKTESSQTEISNTTDGPLYQTSRTELKGYRFDVPNGTYEVELLFADIFQQSKELPYQLRKEGESISIGNAFHVYINSRIVEEACCPEKEAGNFHAVRKRYIISVQNGNIEVRLETINGKNFLNGIKLRKL